MLNSNLREIDGCQDYSKNKLVIKTFEILKIRAKLRTLMVSSSQLTNFIDNFIQILQLWSTFRKLQ